MGVYVSDNNGKLIKVSGLKKSGESLVLDHTFTTTAKEFTVSDLDIVKDGGVYDIVITSPRVSFSGNFKFRINGVSSSASYVQSFLTAENAQAIVSQQSTGTSAYLGTFSSDDNISEMTLTLSSNNVPMWHIQSVGYAGSLYYQIFYGYSVAASNITSLTILSDSNVPAGLNIKIFRRV